MSRFYEPKLIFAFFLVSLSLFNACDNGPDAVFSGEGFADECVVGAIPGSDDACPAGDGFAQFCSESSFGNNICLNVCNDATNLGAANGNAGDFCETDSQCDAGLTCDNDQVGSSSCQCVGGAPEPPPTDECPSVVTDPASVPFGGACDEDADCADEMPCVDCRCV